MITAAHLALQDVGYAGASAREIAKRADCNQALIFYHFGTVDDLLLAVLDDVSAHRMAAYSELVEQATTAAELVDSAKTVFSDDLAHGHLAVLVELITAASSVPGLGDQVTARLEPWRRFAADAVRKALRGTVLAPLLPANELGDAVVAGILGLELLADLDHDQARALALFDRLRAVAVLVDLTGGPFRARRTAGARR